MILPQLNPTTDNITIINQFAGYNHNLMSQDNEWFDMENMTNDYFPVMGNRAKRGYIRRIEAPMAMLGGKSLAFVDADNLYYNETLITKLDQTGEERHLVMMGAYLCVFPDGVIYNTNTGELKSMENEVTAEAPIFTLCKLDGTNYDSDNTITSNTEPEDKTKHWLDTSADPVVLKMYSQSLSMWVSIPTTYVKIEAEGIGKGFSPYDAADISGVDKTDAIYNNYDFNKSNLIYDCGDDFIVVVGLINKTFTNSGQVTVKRKTPKMDFVCELDNRIWGCSSDNHEIYACKQGDPTNWYCYAGLDSDSYAVTVGTEDIFTGCCSYGGTVFFFKEQGFHRLFGTKPSNYEMQWKPGRGVQKGSHRSICVVGDLLMFKSRDSVCAYDGSVSVVSAALGSKNYYDAVAGSYRDKYYICMRDESYNHTLFVYDTRKGTWCKEDNKEFMYLAYSSNGMYMLSSDGNLALVNTEHIYTKLWAAEDLYPSYDLYPGDVKDGAEEEDFSWSLTTPDIGMDSQFNKYVKRINMRFMLDVNAELRVDVMYDDDGNWLRTGNFFATKKKNYELPIPVRRCDHMKLRLSGNGEFRLYSIAKSIEGGSA